MRIATQSLKWIFCKLLLSGDAKRALRLTALALLSVIAITSASAQTISSVSPTSISAGSPDFTIILTGSGFTSSSVVYWWDAYVPPGNSDPTTFYGSGVPLVTIFVSSNQLQATVPTALVGSARHNLGVVMIGPSFPFSSYVGVQIILPSTTSISPQPIYEGANNTITIDGSAFIPGSTALVFWQGNGSYTLPLPTTYVNPSRITAVFPATFIEHPGGTYSLSVANCYNPQPPVGTTYTTCSSSGIGLSVVPVPTVNISGTTPTTGLPGYLTWLPDARPGNSYSFAFSGSNGKPPYTWSTPTPQDLPQGLSLSSAGVLAGTTLGQGTEAVQITLTDSNGVTATAGFGLAVGPIQISFSAVLSGQVGTPFGSGAILLGSYGGHFPLTWTVVNGPLPPGSTLTAPWKTSFFGYQEAILSGTPTAAGVYPVKFMVSDASGTSSTGTMTITVTGPVVITSLLPSSGTAGGPGFLLTVNGTGFSTGAVVNWNGTALPTNFVTASKLTATVAADLIASQGNASVGVTSVGVTSAPVTFTITSGPTITSLNPSSATAGATALTLTMSGTGFASSAIVNWNGSPLATTFVDDARLTAAVPANLIATTGAATITVTSGGLTSNSATFTIVSGPTISSMSPNAVTLGSAAFTLTVTGTGFASGAIVNWNGTALITTFVSTTELTASVAKSLIATPGTASITVISIGVTSNTATFTIASGPIISSLNPSTVPAGDPAFILTANGTGFASGAVLNWNGIGLQTTFVNATQLTASVAANLIATPGTAAITVVSGGATSNALTVTITSLVIPAITLTGLQPTTVPTQSVSVGVQLNGAAPVALQGTLSLSFRPLAGGLPAGYADPALQFAAGGTTLNFTIPAGATTVTLPQNGAIQQGTVAGDITVSLASLTTGTTNVMPQVQPTSKLTIPALPPVIVASSVKIINLTSSGFGVQLTAYSTPRDLSTATFAFAATPGTQVNGSPTISVNVGSAFSTWYQSTDGLANGSAFQLLVPFTFSGDPSLLQSVTATLTNSVGTSQPTSGGK